MTAKQIKSKQRVTDHGEVFTAEREVKAMCDLVLNECLRIDSRFLEPACGNGNFLAEILNRKLDIVTRRYKKSPYDYERNALLALGSLYGVEILQDNVMTCRYRLFSIWNERYEIAIIFSQWAFATGPMMKREDYTFEELLRQDELSPDKEEPMQMSFALDYGEAQSGEEGTLAKIYPPIHYRRLREYG